MKGLFLGASMRLSDKKICVLYQNDKLSCAAIAKLDGRSESTIYNIIRSSGINLRDRSTANQIFPTSIIIKLYNLGLSCSQIGRLLGIDASTITKRLQTNNFPMRSKSMAANIRYSKEEFQRYFFNPKTLKALANAVRGE